MCKQTGLDEFSMDINTISLLFVNNVRKKKQIDCCVNDDIKIVLHSEFCRDMLLLWLKKILEIQGILVWYCTSTHLSVGLILTLRTSTVYDI